MLRCDDLVHHTHSILRYSLNRALRLLLTTCLFGKCPFRVLGSPAPPAPSTLVAENLDSISELPQQVQKGTVAAIALVRQIVREF
jgi:hypothetical protein